jgi:FAD-linked sulfhydryl oxidase
MVEMLQKAQEAAAATSAAAKNQSSTVIQPQSSGAATAAAVASNKNNLDDEKNNCPPNSSQLGKASWTLFHSMAAWYPDVPTERDQQLMMGFYDAVAQFYPCTWCAKDFTRNIQQSPVRAQSRTELCQWLCEQHNTVNEKLGKPLFDCTMTSLDERWRKSNKPECQGGSSSPGH